MDNNPPVPMPPSSQSQKKLLPLVLFLVLVIVAIIGYFAFKHYNKEEAPLPPVEKPEFSILPVPTETLPDKFPADFPLEKNVPVNANYNAQTEGAFQSTRQFVSQKTLAQNYTLYTDYLKKDGWTIEAALDQETVKAIFASKGSNMSVTINISRNESTAENTVDISFVYR